MTRAIALANTGTGGDNAAMLARLTDRTYVTDSVVELELELPDTVDYLPGQFARVEVSPGVWRDYTIIDLHQRRVCFLVDAGVGGSGARFAEALAPRAEVPMKLPMGEFTLADSDRPKVLVATGTGLAPFIAMGRDALRHERPVSLEVIFGCRNRSDDLTGRYMPERRATPQIDLTVCLSGEPAGDGYRAGYVTEALHERSASTDEAEYYLCGNPDMVADAVELLQRRGKTHIFTEPY